MENFRAWRATVLAQVRFWPDRKDIEKELTAHYEDHVRDLERLDYPWKLAEQRALDAMGDPEEIGRALDRVHKPWLGWLWVASRAVLILTLVTALFLGAEPMGQWLHRAKNTFFPPEDLGMYQEELSPYQTINQEAGREGYEVRGALTGETVPIGEDYTLSVVKGCWWGYQDQFWQGQCLLRLEPEHHPHLTGPPGGQGRGEEHIGGDRPQGIFPAVGPRGRRPAGDRGLSQPCLSWESEPDGQRIDPKTGSVPTGTGRALRAPERIGGGAP